MLGSSDNSIPSVICAGGVGQIGLDGGMGGGSCDPAALAALRKELRQLAQIVQQLQNSTQTLASKTREVLQKIITDGAGVVQRFQLTSTLIPAGSATAHIASWDDGGFTSITEGVVFDEEPGGFWHGLPPDEGWCTVRDGTDAQYSILVMSKDVGSGAIVTSTNGATTTNLSQLLTTLGSKPFLPPLGIWKLFGTLTSTLSLNGTASMTVTGSSQTVTVGDALLTGSQTVTSGKRVAASWNVVKRRYDVDGAACT